MPDVPVRSDGQLTTLHRVLRAGRHSLLVPAAHAASVLADPKLRPYLGDFDVVSADATPVVLIRPDGHVAARGRPGSLELVAGYLRDLFGPARQRMPQDDPAAADDAAADAVSTRRFVT